MRRSGIVSLALVTTLLGMPCPAHALSFNVTFDPSTAGAPAEFATAFNSVIGFYTTTYADPMTINLHVGWGDINGGPLAPGNIGQSLTNQQAVPYATLHTALTNDTRTASDAMAVGSLPAADPTPGRNFAMSNAEAKALGLLAANAAGNDGWVGFNRNVTYAFDPNNRAVAGAFDFFGVASHEVTEVMGRYGFGQNGAGGRDSPIDLFRYFSAGGRNLSPTFGGGANIFSIDGGATSINTFNTVCCGDLSDWAGSTLDAYNAFLGTGVILSTSDGDLIEMDVLGYDRVTSVPEPAPLLLVAVGLGMPLVLRARKRRADLPAE